MIIFFSKIAMAFFLLYSWFFDFESYGVYTLSAIDVSTVTVFLMSSFIAFTEYEKIWFLPFVVIAAVFNLL